MRDTDLRSQQYGEKSKVQTKSHLGHHPRGLQGSYLQLNPFALLGVTTRDDRKRIVHLAEERSLELDHDQCQKARTDLISPRIRLGVELSWLPGISPRKSELLLAALHSDPMSIRCEVGLPTLAHLNLLGAVFEAVDSNDSVDFVASFIKEVAELADCLSADQVLRDINEDRSISGFPEVKGVEQIESGLTERKRYYRNAIKDALNRLAPISLVETMTSVVEDATSNGEAHASELIDELVDSYAVETQGFLQKETDNAQKLIQAAIGAAKNGESAVEPLVLKLEMVARNWDRVAQPIQLSAKARGIEHDASRDFAISIRELALNLYNEHDMLALSQHLTLLIQELFAELPEVAERVEEDSETLSGISKARSESAAIEPVRTLCERVLKNIELNPQVADNEGLRLVSDAEKLLKSSNINPNSSAYVEAKNLLAITLMRCAIAFGNKTLKWGRCASLLEDALKLAQEESLQHKIRENLTIVKANNESLGDLEPVEKAPSLFMMNGIGVRLYGSTDKNLSDGSYMATYYFTVIFIPIFPITRYRVISSGNSYRFLGKGRLRTFDKWHLAISLGLIALMFMNA